MSVECGGDRRGGNRYKGKEVVRFVTYNCQKMVTEDKRDGISRAFRGSAVGLQQTTIWYGEEGENCTTLGREGHKVYCFSARKGKERVVDGCAIMIPRWMESCVRRVALPGRQSVTAGRAGLVRIVGFEGGGLVDITVIAVYAKTNACVKGAVDKMKRINTEQWERVEWEVTNAPGGSTVVILTDANGHLGSAREGRDSSIGRNGKETETGMAGYSGGRWTGRRRRWLTHAIGKGSGKTYFGGGKYGGYCYEVIYVFRGRRGKGEEVLRGAQDWTGVADAKCMGLRDVYL